MDFLCPAPSISHQAAVEFLRDQDVPLEATEAYLPLKISEPSTSVSTAEVTKYLR